MAFESLYVSSFVLGALGAYLVGRFAGAFGLVDCPNERSSHCIPTPKGGGIGILISFLLSSVATGTPTAIWLPLTVLSLIAFYGDYLDLSPKVRLCIQFSLCALLVVFGGRISGIPTSSPLWILFWTVFIVGTANFYNFMDGINGIAGITGVLGFAFLAAYIHSNGGQMAFWTVAICVSLSCLGFLPLNMPKAKVFMGDVGSILLGGAYGGLVYMASNTFQDFICMISFLFPFYADELTTMIVRIRDGENLTQAHRRHLYQLLANEKSVAHWQVSVSFGFIQFVVAASVLAAKTYGTIAVLSVLAGYSLAFALVSFYLRSTLEGPRPVEAA